jgi:hypothetical protein
MPMGSCSSLANQRLWKEQLRLGAGVVEDQRRAVLFDGLQHGGDRVFAATTGPGGLFLGRQHRDIRIGAGVGLKYVARVGVAGEEPGDGLRIFHGCG